MKPFTNNPRQLSKTQAKRLKETMQEFGDLSGIVHDLDTDEVIGGNQRSNVAALMQTQPVITERFSPPLPDGTAALGYFEYQGRRFAYRAVTGWDADKRLRANLTANAGGGAWDIDLLSGIDTSVLTSVGFDTEMLLNTRGFAGALLALTGSEQIDYAAEWVGMPEFEQEDLSAFRSLHIHFQDQAGIDRFSELIGQKITDKTRALWYPPVPKIDMKSEAYTDEP